MSNVAVRVEGLGKMYRIGGKQERYRTLRDSLTDAVSAPFKRARSLLHGQAYGAAGLHEEIWALKDVSFEVHHGEVVGIIGRNGAGKSTLLKILSRITEPTEGYADVYGRVGSLLEVGTGFHPELTGRENIYLNGAILGMGRAEIDRKFDEIVGFAEVERFIDTPVKHYSSGMGLRLGFAVAAHLEPEILVVDEVLAVGDAQFQKKCLGKMSDVASEGRTVLFVSHNMAAVQSLCERGIQLDQGKLLQDGSSVDVISSYLEVQSTETHDQEWPDPDSAPGNDIVRLRRIWSKSEDATMGDSVFPIDHEISIGIEYWKLVPQNQIHITLHVYSEQQVVAFTTASFHGPDWKELPLQTGLFRSKCQIPAHFLNVGLYRITLLVVQDRSRVIYRLEDALSLDVVEIGPRDGAYFGKQPGVIRPLLPWYSEYLGEYTPRISE